MNKVVLIITSSIDETVDYIIEKYKNVSFFRLNVDFIGKYRFKINEYGWQITEDNRTITNKSVYSIYYRKPLLPNINEYSQEYAFVAQKDIVAFINGLADSFGGRVLSRPYLLRKAENKVFQLIVAQEFNFKLPGSIITNNISDLEIFFNAKSIIKPISIGKVKFASKCNLHTTAILKKYDCDICVTPVYVQKYINKKYEVRITIIDNSCFAVAIKSVNKVDWRISVLENEYWQIECPESIELQCHNILKKNNLIFGAFDFIVDPNDNWFFLEFNPNGQWLWLEKILGVNISGNIIKYLSGIR